MSWDSLSAYAPEAEPEPDDPTAAYLEELGAAEGFVHVAPTPPTPAGAPPREGVAAGALAVRELREREELTQEQLAERLGVTRAAVGNFELAKTHVPRALAAYLVAIGYGLELVAVRGEERVLLK